MSFPREPKSNAEDDRSRRDWGRKRNLRNGSAGARTEVCACGNETWELLGDRNCARAGPGTKRDKKSVPRPLGTLANDKIEKASVAGAKLEAHSRPANTKHRG